MHHILMDDISMENWQKIKDAMEASGNTDNFYYKRACAVLAGQKDPINDILKPKDEQIILRTIVGYLDLPVLQLDFVSQ